MVPYKGSGPAVVDLAAGHVQIMFHALPALYGQIKAGRLRVLASVYPNAMSSFLMRLRSLNWATRSSKE